MVRKSRLKTEVSLSYQEVMALRPQNAAAKIASRGRRKVTQKIGFSRTES